MLHCFTANGSSTDMTVLERQRARRKWEEERLLETEKNLSSYSCFKESKSLFSSSMPPTRVQSFQGLMGRVDSEVREVVVASLKPEPGMDIVWPELELPIMWFGSSGMVKRSTELEESYSVSRASSCKPSMGTAAAGEVKRKELTEKMNSVTGINSFKKRKAEKIQNGIVSSGEDIIKKIKSSAEGAEPMITDQHTIKTKNNNTETSADASKESNAKASEVQKPDYIHVRARRGQATDSHSLAERVRREKISERMRYLQDLVPGCNKITGKAGMLDEIINYVQSLQRQVEFLSMKLAALNPRPDLNVDELFSKEVFSSCQSNSPNLGGISSVANNSAHKLFNPLPQMLPYPALDMAITPSEVGLRRTISAPVSFIPETFIDSSSFAGNQPPSTWNADLQNFYNIGFDQGR